MSEHTGEPWAFEKIEGDEKTGWEASLIPCSGVDADWHCFVTAWGLQYNDDYPQRNGREISKANALRIVACVNACAGMADPAAEIGKLKGQRDRAVAALKTICKKGTWKTVPCKTLDGKPVPITEQVEWYAKIASAAIAEIEGGE